MSWNSLNWIDGSVPPSPVLPPTAIRPYGGSPTANTLYNKHIVMLESVNPLTLDSTGSQKETYAAAVPLVCNVQLNGAEPTVLGVPAPYAGKIFAQPFAVFKARDLVTHQGRKFRIDGVKMIQQNIPPYADHHLEGTLYALDSIVQIGT